MLRESQCQSVNKLNQAPPNPKLMHSRAYKSSATQRVSQNDATCCISSLMFINEPWSLGFTYVAEVLPRIS